MAFLLVMLSTTLFAEPLTLLASGAIFLPEHHALLVADAHFGKATSFRALGVPVPSGTTSETLSAIDHDLAATSAQHIIFLGDFLHSARAHAASTQTALLAWRARYSALNLSLVRGNHDDRAGDPPAALGIAVVNEPLRLGPWALCHHPQSVADAYTLAGHLHPCVVLQGKARERLRLPCFWLGAAVGVLPAYGAFTGMHPINPALGDCVFAIAGDVVRALPVTER